MKRTIGLIGCSVSTVDQLNRPQKMFLPVESRILYKALNNEQDARGYILDEIIDLNQPGVKVERTNRFYEIIQHCMKGPV
jgi:hypothetical protein